jgi:hypothetical protein
MAAPSTFTVTGTWYTADGTAFATGFVVFTPRAGARSVNTGDVIPPTPIVATLASGVISQVLAQVTAGYDVVEVISKTASATAVGTLAGINLSPAQVGYSIPGTANIDLSAVAASVPALPNFTAYLGVWAAGTTYQLGAIVTYAGSAYVALTTSTAQKPSSSPAAWALLAAGGSLISAATKTTLWYGNTSDIGVAVQPAASALELIPFDVPGASMVVSNLGFYLNASGTTGTSAIKLAIYDVDSFGLPGVLLCQANGTIDGTTAPGAKTLPLTRADAGCVTVNGSVLVTDVSAVLTDVGRTVTGTGIAGSTVVTGVTPGVSFTMSNPATASGTVTVTMTNFKITQPRVWLAYVHQGTASTLPAPIGTTSLGEGVDGVSAIPAGAVAVRGLALAGVSGALTADLTGAGYTADTATAVRVLAQAA